jgi:hypothetical protein
VIFAGTDGDTRGPHVSAAELFELSLVLSDGRTLMGSHAVMGRGCPTELLFGASAAAGYTPEFRLTSPRKGDVRGAAWWLPLKTPRRRLRQVASRSVASWTRLSGYGNGLHFPETDKDGRRDTGG